ncbi:hypothetical protein quinque_000211 [Culex quinquefasciatus]
MVRNRRRSGRQTCLHARWLNPNENEAVLLAEMVRNALFRRSAWNDLQGTDQQGHASPRKLPHCLPTAPAPALEDMVKFNLERCNLALLHQQNTGRLFIVLFEKRKKLLSEVFRRQRPAKRNHSKEAKTLPPQPAQA